MPSSPTPSQTSALPATATPAADASLPRGVPAAPSLFEEERAKDMALLKHTGKNRVRITLVLSSLFLVLQLLGIVDVPIPVTLVVTGTAMLFSTLLEVASRRVYLPAWRYAAATLDSLMISLSVFLGGKPILVVIYFLSIVPYALDRGAAVGQVATLVGVLGFVTAQWLHWDVFRGVPTPWSDVLLAALLLMLAAQQAIMIPARLERRMRRAREQMAKVERGDLSARAPARHDDELGFLERSLNRMLDELLTMVATVQREAAALVRVASEVEGAVAVMRGRGQEVTAGAHTLNSEVARHRVAVREGMQESQEASQGALSAREVAVASQAATRSMDAVMLASRSSIDEAAEMLVRAGESVESAAERVRRLGPASEQVGDFVARVSRIARQTNLLALNAAIEAARAGEEGAGFAVVADEIRALAVESAQAAKVIATTVQRVRDDMTEAVRAIDTTSSELSGARSTAQEARAALTTLSDEMAQVAERAERVLTLSEQQAAASRSVAATFDALEGVSQRVSVEARRAADATAGQQVSIEALATVAAELSDSAHRLRMASRADWYHLMRTAEYPNGTLPDGTGDPNQGGEQRRTGSFPAVAGRRPTPVRPAAAVVPSGASTAA